MMESVDRNGFQAFFKLPCEIFTKEISTEKFLFDELGLAISDYSPEKQKQYAEHQWPDQHHGRRLDEPGG